MDGLSAAASVIAVVQIAQSLGSALKDYYQGVRDARDDINALHCSVKSLEEILKELEGFAKEGTIDKSVLQDPKGLLGHCRNDLFALESRLAVPTTAQGRRGRYMRYLKWPFQKEDVRQAVDMIERHKSALSLYLGARNLSSSLKQSDLLAEIQQEILQAQSDSKRQLIIKWLHIANPSLEHNAARQKLQAGTGSWLVSGEKFETWMKSDNSGLWLNGDAGCGKTILCSTAITKLQDHCKGQPNSAIAYWYFTFADQAKLNLSNFLSSVILQLLSQRADIPNTTNKEWGTSGDGTLSPSVDNLLKMLHAAMDGFEDVFLVFDALDECPRLDRSREYLLDIIHRILLWKEDAMHILLTSRNEIDIREALFTSSSELQQYELIGVQENNVDSDIQAYIRGCLVSPSFKRWSKDLKLEVEQALSSRAQGVFRLVSLQLDELRRISMMSAAKVRLVVNNLPPTLDAFYDRLLLEIDPLHSEQALTIFRWIAFSPHPLTLAELAEVLTIHPESDQLVDPDDRLMDPFSILEILPSGLVSIPKTPPIETALTTREPKTGDSSEMFLMFSHFSVKEYFLSAQMGIGPTASFALGEQISNREISAACIAYILWVGNTSDIELPDSLLNEESEKLLVDCIIEKDWREKARKLYTDEYVLLEYASRCWSYYIQMLEGDLNSLIASLLLRFMEQNSPAFDIWRIVICEAKGLPGDISKIPDVNANELPTTLPSPALYRSSSKTYISLLDDPLGYAVWLGLTKVVELLFENSLTGTGHGRENTNVLPWVYLTRAAAMGWKPLVRYLLAHGAEVNAIGPKGPNILYDNVVFGTALEAAAKFGHLEIAKILLDAGTDVDKQGTSYAGTKSCAFDAALRIQDPVRRKEMVNCLIDAGVDVNYQLHTNGFCGNGCALAMSRFSDELFDTVLAAGASDESISLAISALEVTIFEGYRHGDGVDAEEAELEVLHRKLKKFGLKDHWL